MKKILVADDEVKIGRLLAQALRDQGYQVTAVNDTQAAWEAIVQNPPDFLITDLKLPPTDGIVLMRQAHVKFPQLPVVMITGFDEADTEALARQAGAKGFFGKPLDLTQVCATVRELIGS